MEPLNEDLTKKVLEENLREKERFENTKVVGGVIGQSGAGKSSLINAIFGEHLCDTGTVETTAEKCGPFEKNGVSFYDLPGCGTTKFPKEDYVSQMELKSFDFLILVTSNRFYENDLFLINEVNKLNKPIFIVRTKIDQAIDDGKFNHPKKDMQQTISECFLDIEQCIAEVKHNGIYLVSSRQPAKFDLGKLINNIHESLNKIKRQKFLAEAFIANEEILIKKRKIAKKIVLWYSSMAGLNGLNPVIGLDIATDITILLKMNKDVLRVYNLDEDSIDFVEQYGGSASLVNSLRSFAQKFLSKELLLIALKKYAPQITVKTISKYIPIIGQLTSVSASFGLCMFYGNKMIKDCEEKAQNVLNEFAATE